MSRHAQAAADPKSVLLLSSATPSDAWSVVEARMARPGTTAWTLSHDHLRCRAPAELKARIRWLDDLLPTYDYERINREATRWAAKWPESPELVQALTFRGVNIGQVIRYPVFNFLNALLRVNAIAERLFESEDPTQLQVFSRTRTNFPLLVPNSAPLLESVAAELARSRDLPVVEWVSQHGRRRLARAVFGTTRRLLRHFRRLALVARARTVNVLRRGRRPITSDGASPVVAFVRSSHSILESAEAFERLRFGSSIYIGLRDEYERKYRERSSSVPFVDLYGEMPFVASPADAAFLSRLDHLLRTTGALAGEPEGSAQTPYLRRFLTEALREYFRDEGPWILRYVRAAERVLDVTGADAVFADTSQQPIERSFFLAARKRNVLTIETAHGMINDIFELGLPEYFITDRFFVWGRRDRALMERFGAHADQLAEAGVARFADYFTYRAARRRTDGIVRIGVTCEREVKYYGVTGFSNLLEPIHERRFSKLIELARADPTIRLSFKLRAGIETDYYLFRMLADAGIQNYEAVRGGDIRAWLNSLDLMLTDFSTLGLEAMIFDVPVLVHRNEAVGDAVGYEASGAVDVVAPDLTNLPELVEQAVRMPAKRAAERAAFVAAAIGPASAQWHEERAARLIAMELTRFRGRVSAEVSSRG